MDENWYAVEQQIRDRLTDARAAARIRTLTRTLAPTARCRTAVGSAFIRLAGRVWARAMELTLERSSGVAGARGAAKRSQSPGAL